MSILEQVIIKTNAFKYLTGKPPTSVYLGEVEMAQLLEWAVDLNYINNKEVSITGEHRPEISGLLVYKVNATNHFKVS